MCSSIYSRSYSEQRTVAQSYCGSNEKGFIHLIKGGQYALVFFWDLLQY